MPYETPLPAAPRIRRRRIATPYFEGAEMTYSVYSRATIYSPTIGCSIRLVGSPQTSARFAIVKSAPTAALILLAARGFTSVIIQRDEESDNAWKKKVPNIGNRRVKSSASTSTAGSRNTRQGPCPADAKLAIVPKNTRQAE